MRNLYTSHGNHAIILGKTQNTTEEELRKTLQRTTQLKWQTEIDTHTKETTKIQNNQKIKDKINNKSLFIHC